METSTTHPTRPHSLGGGAPPSTQPTGLPPLDPRSDARRDLARVATGITAFGLFLGVTASATSMNAAAVLLGAPAVYGGSAQLATLTTLHLGAGVVAAALAGIVVNARLLLYSAALAPWFRGHPRWFRLLGAAFVLDQTYLAVVERPAYRGSEAFRQYWGWLGGSILVVWTGAVGTGMVLGPLVPPMPHLVLVGTALFVTMLVPRLVDRTSVVAVAAAASTALAVSQVAPQAALLAGAVGGVAGAVSATRAGERRS